MPRPRTPTAVAKLTGAAAMHPERYKERSDPKQAGPLGNPPAFFDASEKAAWRSFKKEWSWLTADDAAALVPLCKMRVEVEKPGLPSVSMLSEYRIAINSFGGNPTAKSKVYQPKDENDKDPFAAFGKVN